MAWLIRQLFGSQASANLTDKIKALVAQYILANPTFSEASVNAWVMSQADHLVAQVLVYFPGWAVAILTEFLNSEISNVIETAFNQIAPKAVQPASS
jgi:hypothetical protein